jgi:capsular polysaccharide biosynthesis protein
VLNEEELHPILNDYGFEIVETENLSFRGKIELLSDAEIVAGPHGGGLTNLLFAPESCRVLELFDPAHMNAAFTRWRMLSGRNTGTLWAKRRTPPERSTQ